MEAVTPASACTNHACDCHSAAVREVPDGVRLTSERRHVRTKVSALLGRSGALTLEGDGWPDRLGAVLAELSFSERTALFAVALDGESTAVALPADDVLLRARTEWLPDLLNGSALHPHLQPIVSLTDGRTYGYESLLRARVGDRELNGGEIVAAARAHGEIFALDLAGRTVALEQGMPRLADDEVLFVNFTPTAIYDPDICLRKTWAIAQRLGVSMKQICFEVVETEQFPDLGFLRRILDAYREQGAMVALDDLGAGHSSLTYLDALRPDIVKFDRALISGIDADPSRQRLVGALIDYAHELDVRVVAEGIETEPELAVVGDLGADLGQGWYLGRPAAEPARVDRNLVMHAKAGRAQGTTLEVRDRALAATTSGVVIADATRAGMPIIYANVGFERLTGYAAADITGLSCKFVQGVATDPAAIAEMGTAIRAGRECRVTLMNYRKDRTPYWCEVHLSPVRDRHGNVVQYVGVQNDVTDRVEAEREMREQRDRAHHLATHDALTGLQNRRAFNDRAAALLDDLTGAQAAAILFVDLNRFKHVNDRYGHDVGDEVLCAAARALESELGADALVARHAGDEFLVCFVAADAASAETRARAATARLTSPLVVHELAGEVTASVGCAISTPAHRLSLSDLVKRADAEMYDDKRPSRTVAASPAD